MYSCILATFFGYFTWIAHREERVVKKRTNSLSNESGVILSLDPYFLKFHYKFKVKAKNFLLETSPFDKYKQDI